MGTRITNLPEATVVNSADVLPIVQGGTTKKAASSLIKTTNAAELTSGTLPEARLPVSGVVDGTYGSSTSVPQIAVDAKGRIVSASSVQISSTAGGTVTSVGVTSSTLGISSSPITSSGNIGIDLPASGVTAGTVGSSTQVPVITADAQGRITALGTAAISSLTTQEVAALTTSQLSAISISAGTGLTGGGNISASRTLSLEALATSPAGTFGNASAYPVITVDQYGRTTAVSTQALSALGVSSFSAGSTGLTPSTSTTGAVTLSGTLGLANGGTGATSAAGARTNLSLVASATTDTTNASNISSGTLSASRLPAFTGDVTVPAGSSVTTLANSGVVAGTVGSSTQIPVITADAKGRITALTTAAVPALGITALTGDVTASGSGSVAATLANSGVTSGVYGSSSTVPQITIDAKGRVTSAANVGISGAAGGTVTSVGVTSSTLTISSSPVTSAGNIGVNLPSSGVVAGTVGSSVQIPVITADAQGRITAMSTAAVSSLTTTQVSALTTSQLSAISISAGTGLTGGGDISANRTLALAALATSPAGTFGSASAYPIITVDQYGRTTAVSTQALPALGVTSFSAGTTGLTPSTGTTGAVTLSGTLGLTNGGTGQTTQQAAINALAGAVTSAQFLRGNGTNVLMSAIQASDVPTLNQNTTGTASNVTGTVALVNGGTGQTTQQAAINALAGATTSGQYLRGNGTNVTMSAIQAADVPTLNQNTTGTAANVTGVVAVANGGTGLSTITGYVKGTGTAALTASSTIPCSDLSGTLSSAQFPALTGDVLTTAGSLVTAISNISAGAVVGSLRETVSLNGTAAASYTIDTLTQAVVYVTANATAAFSINIRASSGTTLNAHMAVGQSLTVVFMATQGTTAYFNSTFNIDGVAATRKWQGGTTPTANASGIDVYSYTIVKTAASTFTVFATLSKYA